MNVVAVTGTVRGASPASLVGAVFQGPCSSRSYAPFASLWLPFPAFATLCPAYQEVRQAELELDRWAKRARRMAAEGYNTSNLSAAQRNVAERTADLENMRHHQMEVVRAWSQCACVRCPVDLPLRPFALTSLCDCSHAARSNSRSANATTACSKGCWQ